MPSSSLAMKSQVSSVRVVVLNSSMQPPMLPYQGSHDQAAVVHGPAVHERHIREIPSRTFVLLVYVRKEELCPVDLTGPIVLF